MKDPEFSFAEGFLAEEGTIGEKIAAGLKDGTISKIAAVIGDDGRAKMRSYYTDLVRALPGDAMLLTAGSVQFRFAEAASAEDVSADKARVWNSGELADAYSIIRQKSFALYSNLVIDLMLLPLWNASSA